MSEPSAPPPRFDHAVDQAVNLVMTDRQRAGYRGLRRALSGASRLWFRIGVTGLEKVPETGAFILAPGAHRSILDTPLAALAVPNRVLRYMGAETYFAIPGLGSFLRSMGGFPVERATTDRAALRLAEEVLSNGEPLVVFPEGTRQSGPLVAELKQGAAFLACRQQVPILPVGIGGADRAMPKGARFVRPTRIHLVVGDLIIPPDRGAGRVKRSAIVGVSDQLRTTLQELYDQARIEAGA